MMNYEVSSFAILNIFLIVIQQACGEPIKCESDSECQGGAYDKCSACENVCAPNCEHPEVITDVLCVRNCESKYCECERGYHRTFDGKCVIRSQCYIEDTIFSQKKQILRSTIQLMYGFRPLPPLKSAQSQTYEDSGIRE